MLGCNSSQQNDQVPPDPLDQWNDGPIKTHIISFIKNITEESSPDFIPVPDRVAVFDMDGTILIEKPFPVNFDVIIRMMIQQIEGNPALTQKQPYKAIHEEDWAYFDTLDYSAEDGVFSILVTATKGYNEDQYRNFISKYFKTVTDKRFNTTYDKLVYVPVVQLIRYLQDNKFEVYIVSGSEPLFTRMICEDAMGIPVQNVIGTSILTQWVDTDTGSCFVRTDEFVQPINDVGGKPVNILNKVGKAPVIAVGNSPGDYHMLEYSKNSPSSLQMIVNHDDSAREYVYDKEIMSKMCSENDWKEISMKNDFRVVFGK